MPTYVYMNNRNRQGGRQKNASVDELRETVYKWQLAVGIIMGLVSVAILVVALVVADREYPRPLELYFNGTAGSSVTVQTIFILLASTIISAIYHLYIAFNKRALKRYAHPMIMNARHNEMPTYVNDRIYFLYGFSITLIYWVVAQIAGIRGGFTVAFVALANIVIQYLAFILELANYNAGTKKSITITPFYFGALVWLVAWAAVLTYLFGTASTAPPGTTVPWYAYVVVLGAFAVTLVYGIVGVLRYWNYKNLNGALTIEKVFTVLEILLTVVVALPLLIGLV